MLPLVLPGALPELLPGFCGGEWAANGAVGRDLIEERGKRGAWAGRGSQIESFGDGGLTDVRGVVLETGGHGEIIDFVSDFCARRGVGDDDPLKIFDLLELERHRLAERKVVSGGDASVVSHSGGAGEHEVAALPPDAAGDFGLRVELVPCSQIAQDGGTAGSESLDLSFDAVGVGE